MMDDLRELEEKLNHVKLVEDAFERLINYNSCQPILFNGIRMAPCDYSEYEYGYVDEDLVNIFLGRDYYEYHNIKIKPESADEIDSGLSDVLEEFFQDFLKSRKK